MSHTPQSPSAGVNTGAGGLTLAELPGADLNKTARASGGTAKAMRKAGRIKLMTPEINSVAITNQNGRFLTDSELEMLHRHVGKYGHASFYVNLLHYLINSDASDKIDPADTVELPIGGVVTRIQWETIFSEMEEILDPNRFTVRRYARSMASELVDLWKKAEVFAEIREDPNNPLAGRGVDGVNAIYTCSFTDHLVPKNLRGTVAVYQSSRRIENQSDYIGVLSAFGTRNINTRSNANDIDVERSIRD